MLTHLLHFVWISLGACVLISNEERASFSDSAVEKIWAKLKASGRKLESSGLTSCKSFDEYKVDTALYSDKWQCGSDANGNFVKSTGAYYSPDASVLAALTDYYSGLTLADLNGMDIYGGSSMSVKGKWCGMPGPDNQKPYWNKCVMPRAGYFNVAYCDTPTSLAYLGVAALSPDVCYPPHNHHANERYWQIAGNSTWRVWKDGNGVKDDTVSPLEVNGKAGTDRYHPDKMSHEMETKPGVDNFMIAEYWWAKDKNGDNDYKWCESCSGTCMNKQPGDIDCKSVFT